MNQEQMIEAAASEVTLGLDGAAQYVYEWVASHPDAAVQTICRKVAEKAGVPDSWNALRSRVQRKQQNGNSQAESGRTAPWIKGRGERAARQVAREEPETLVAGLTPSELDRLAAATHEARVQNVRAAAGIKDQTLSEEDEQSLAAGFADSRERSTIEMAELFVALSRVRVKGIEVLVENASASERREWTARLPDEIALLQLALDLSSTRKLEAVNG
jgi:hypothetical protein